MKRLLMLGAVVCLGFLALHQTEGFDPLKLSKPLEGSEDIPHPATLSILNQPFSYLSKGRQCFVFESADRQYVLKVFNKLHFQMPFWTYLVPESLKGVERAKRAQRLSYFQTSYPLAFQKLKEETGLLFVHLHQSGAPLPLLRLTNKAGNRFSLDPNEVAFILQRKGQSLAAGFSDERGIEAYLGLISKRISKGIVDNDRDVKVNFGYLENKPLLLDPGRLHFSENLTRAAELAEEWEASTRRFRKWIKNNHPELLAKFDLENEKALNELLASSGI